ncbi:hypothetical protein [Alteribacter aurantiacus]|uniref:hypothetical protein n=1 Tax=Alteribacter aurantiacus TaxID=254410 RepID=UPI00040DB1CD|nr:hypothetical protein [Alteribacter aurantiacus]
MPLRPLVKTAIEYAKNNPKAVGGVILAAGTVIISGAKDVHEFLRERKKTKLAEGGYPYRQERFLRFKGEILKNIHLENRKELYYHILEVEEFQKMFIKR